MSKIATKTLDLKEVKILYDAGGEPEFVLLPIEQLNIYSLTDDQIVAAVDEIRSELFQRKYAQKVKGSA